VSASDAWAVGDYGSNGRTFLLHWNGKAWKVVEAPGPAGPDNLYGVAALSASDAWAVGYDNAGNTSTLIEHWNGTRWTVVPSPTPADGGELYAVAAVSARNAWAVGGTEIGGHTLVEHWNGAAWSIVPAPSPVAGAQLWSVTGTPDGSAWAAGWKNVGDSGITQGMLLQWNGHIWTQVALPAKASGDQLAVFAVSATDLWVVTDDGLKLHWNGTGWHVYGGG